MRKMKKLASLLLALVMVLSLSVTAMASSGTGTDTPTEELYTITITSEKSGHTYEAYHIFTGTLNETKTVLSDVEWSDGVDSTALLAALKTDTLEVVAATVDADNNPVAAKTVADLFASCTTAADVAKVLSDNNTNSALAEEFAQLASENLTTIVAGTSHQDYDTTDLDTGETTYGVNPDGMYEYSIANLSVGYYLIKDKDNSVTAAGDAYTDIILEVLCNVKVESKAEYPTVTKTVSDEDASINDTVTYTLTGTVPDTSAYDTYTYIFHDTLSKGLTINSTTTGEVTTYELTVTSGTSTLTLGSRTTDGDGKVTESGDYILTVTSNSDGTTSIDIEILNAKSYSNSSIIVTYTATLNSDAVIGDDGNDNKVKVEYSNNPNWVDDGNSEPPTGDTPEDVVVTWTFKLDVTKVDGKDSSKTLEGAEFVLYKTVKETVEGVETDVNYYVQVDTSSKVTGWTTDVDAASTLTSDTSGNFSIIGLDAGTYYLKETEAPSGYNLLVNPVTIVITAEYEDTDGDGKDEIKSLTATADGDDLSAVHATGIVSAEIENNAGSTLPSTGGIGTTIFYVVGTIMVLGAAVVLITRRRMSSAK